MSVLVVVGLPAQTFATSLSSSSDYQVDQVFFGSGGELNSCSTDYCSKQSAGELTVGNTASSNYQAQGGFNTNREPFIEFDVSNTNVDLGTLSPNTTATTTATFSVSTYLAHGYTVVNASDPPTNNSHTMTALTTPTASAAGTEQFGINLAANTVPTTFGADPSLQPDSTFSYGEADIDYSAANYFKYVKGDAIASSTKSTSQTLYTISYIFNISHITPGGTYTFHHVLVATSTF
jgi:hypothetical protein